MEVALVYSTALDAYDFGPQHPLRPERVSLAVALMEAYGLVAEGALVPLAPRPATEDELLRVHDRAYVDAVQRFSASGRAIIGERGIGPGDTPPFKGMHEAAALIAGATTVALEAVTSGRFTRAFSPAGGLHHAHRDHAAGFCVYNDVAVAIAAALDRDPALRIFYLDIDAHHGDGVQEAFYAEPRVFTLSIHESGRHLFPGTGFPEEHGEGAGLGTALNVPMPPNAGDEDYALVFDEVVVPAVREFAPDLIVAQCGADAHRSDPLTHLALTLGGFRDLYRRIVVLADECCGGRLLATGGGGYSWPSYVPRAWTMLAAELVGRELPEELPEAWLELQRELGLRPPEALRDDPGPVSRDYY